MDAQPSAHSHIHGKKTFSRLSGRRDMSYEYVAKLPRTWLDTTSIADTSTSCPTP